MERGDCGAPATGVFAGLFEGADEGRASEQCVDGGAEGSGAFAVDDSDGVNAPGLAFGEVGWDEGSEVLGRKSVQVEFAGDGDQHRGLLAGL